MKARNNCSIAKLLMLLTILVCLTEHKLAMAASKFEDNWAQVQQRGTEALDAGQYWIAEPTLLKALALSEKFGSRDLRLAKSLGELGRLYTIRGWNNQAEPYLEEELSIKEQVFGEEIGEIVPAMGSLIVFYLTCNMANKADPLTEKLLLLVEGKLKDPNSLTKTTVKLKPGAPLQGWAGTAAPVAFDKLIDCAVTCDNLGDLYSERGNFDLADRLFKAALDLKATVLGKQHISLANSYERIGGLCLARNELAEAESYLRDALTTTERVLQTDNPDVYAQLDKLAKCLIKEGKYQQAEELYLRAQNFWKENSSKNGDEARAVYALGSLYADEKKYEAAAPLLQQAMQLAEQFHGPLSINLVPYLQRYAYVLYYLGQKEETNQLRDRANTISGSER